MSDVLPRPQYQKAEKAAPASSRQKRKKGMKRVSQKRATLNAIVNPGRKGFLLLYPVCMVCEQEPSVDCHEIARGAAREACLTHPELWLAVCRDCHDDLDNTTCWPPAKQLALRIRADTDETVMVLNVIRGHAQTAITAGDVFKHLDMLT